MKDEEMAEKYLKEKLEERKDKFIFELPEVYITDVKQAFLAELENKIADIKANCDLAIEGRDVKIKELKLELTVEKDQHQEETNLHLHAEDYIKSLEQQIEKMKRHCNCKHRDSEGYCEVKRTYLIDLSYDGCDKWELED